MPNKRLKYSKSFKIKKTLVFLIPLLLLFFASAGHPSEKQSMMVREALTGDSLRLQGGQILRYIGLQSPPLQSSVVLIREYGNNALLFNQSLVNGKKVWVEWGSQIRDDQNRLLGYVFLGDGTSINKAILKAGHGKMVLTPPNTKYSGEFRRAELEARRERRGLWEKEPQNPYLKKEYLGEKNTKIYYFPNSPELERIPQANLVTFRSRVEAKAAGYRACFTCNEDKEALY